MIITANVALVAVLIKSHWTTFQFLMTAAVVGPLTMLSYGQMLAMVRMLLLVGGVLIFAVPCAAVPAATQR